MSSNMADLPPAAVASFQYQKEHINDDRRPLLLAVNWSLYALVLVALSLRIYAKRMIRGKFGLEDAWILLAFIAVTGICTISTVGVSHGAGRHLILATPYDMIATGKDFYAYAIIYTTAIASIKASVLSFYYRTFRPNRSFRIAVWCVAGIVGCWWVATIGTCIFACTPISYFWNKNQPGHCYDEATGQLSTSIVNICTDFIIVTMPMPVVWKLHLPLARRVAVSSIILLGGIVVLASIMRIPNLHSVNTFDFPYDAIPIGLWTTAELCLGILGACLPLMSPIFRKVIEVSSAKFSKGSIGHSWPHTNLEEGRTRNSKKKGHKDDDIPLTNHNEWAPAVPQNDTRIQTKRASDMHNSSKSSITRDIEFEVELKMAK